MYLGLGFLWNMVFESKHLANINIMSTQILENKEVNVESRRSTKQDLYAIASTF